MAHHTQFFETCHRQNVYVKRVRNTVAKMMRLQCTQDLDFETLDAMGYWATMEELLEVVTFHLPLFENTVKMCKTSPGQVSPRT